MPTPSRATAIARIAALEGGLLADLTDPNPLLPLLAFARHDAAEVVHKAVWALHRVFVPLITGGHVGGIVHAELDKLAEDEPASEGSSKGKGKGRAGSEGSEDGRAVRGWVRARLGEYVTVLGGLMRDSEAALRSSSIPLLFSLLAPLSATLPGQPALHVPYFRIILSLLFNPLPSLRGASDSPPKPAHQVEEDSTTLPADVVALVVDDYFAKYDDLRWAFFREARHSLPLPDTTNFLSILLPLTNLPREQADLNAFFLATFSSAPASTPAPPPGKKRKPSKNGKFTAELDALPDWMDTYASDASSDEDKGSKRPRERTSRLSTHAAIHSIPSHVNVYTDLWLALLAQPIDDVWTRRVLVGLHGPRGVLAHMAPTKRVQMTDWLGGLVDRGGALGMLAMNGLFVLMTTYNLDYPDFYPRLYTLLTPALLHSKYRARFFRLLDTFLRSPLLPAALVASFIKRLSRRALTAPPAGVLIVVPFVYNLFKRHKGCMVMIQRWDADGEDPYDENDPSPLTSRAIESSCYELASLAKHYTSSAATMAGIFKEVFTKPEFNMEDFLDHGYSTMFETEIARKIRNPPALSLAIEMQGTGPAGGAGLFPEGDGERDELLSLGEGRGVVGDLWAF